jgi:hypothetical protein
LKKIIQITLSLLLAVAVLLPGTAIALADSSTEAERQPVLQADSENEREVTTYPLRSLVIRAPENAEVGQPVTIKVLTRQNYEPVAGAAVYALKTDNTITSADQNDYTTVANKYASIARTEGIYIGKTNDDGTVRHTFKDTGRYVLVAIKDGFIPGFEFIIITLSAEKGLMIKAPSSAEVNTPVTITVLERNSYEPVARAAVYAKKIGEITTSEVQTTSISGTTDTTIKQVKPSMITSKQVITARPAIAAVDDAQQVEEIRREGFLIGYTNERGEVEHRFSDTGHYIMAAIKDDYAPGFARISIILANQKALGIRAPGWAKVEEPVTFLVYDRRTGEAVSKAGVYALKIREAEVLESSTEPAYYPEDVTVNITDEYLQEVRDKGIFIGYTNEKGEIDHTFENTGLYLVVAFKDGYIPAVHRISITLANQRTLAIKAPSQAEVGEPVTITVYERNTSEPVERAAVYAIKAIEAETVPPVEAVPEAETPAVIEQATRYTDIKPTVIATSESEMPEKRFLIGYTDESGQLVHKFGDSGIYQLVAIKSGYTRGTARITITLTNQKALVIRAPQEAKVNERVRIEVQEQNAYQGVRDADVFALRVETIDEAIRLILKAADGNLARVVESNGTHLGSTDEYGILVTGFSRTGHYMLMAAKSGYTPDFTSIQISPNNVAFPWNIKLFKSDSNDAENE